MISQFWYRFLSHLGEWPCKRNMESVKIFDNIQGKGLDIGHNGDYSFKNDNVTKLNIYPGENIDIVANGESLPFEDGRFDKILLRCVLEHVKDPGKILMEASRVLNRKGKTIAKINGHTVAGGFILAASCDRIYCETGTYKLGMNEEKLGIKLPPLVQAIIQCTFGDDMNKILCNDDFYTPEDMAQFKHFSNHEISFEEVTKDQERLEQINQFMAREKDKQLDIFLDSWFSEKSISARNTAINSLKKR